jgi:hypothetical protein
VTNVAILELRGGPYDGHEGPTFPRAVAPCQRCGARQDLWLQLPPLLNPVEVSEGVVVVVATTRPPGVQPRQPAARYSFLEARDDRVVYEYRESAEAVWLGPRPHGVDPCSWDPCQ